MPSPSPSEGASTGAVLTADTTLWIVWALLILIALVVVTQLFLSLTFRPTEDTPAGGTTPVKITNLLQVPYVTWYLLHYTIAAVAILVIAVLGILNVIDKGVISALLGSLLGYVLGSAPRPQAPSGGLGGPRGTGGGPQAGPGPRQGGAPAGGGEAPPAPAPGPPADA